MKGISSILLATTTVLALAVVTPGSAATNAAAGEAATNTTLDPAENFVYGLAKEDDGSYCGNDCLAVVWSHAEPSSKSGAVSNSQSNCQGNIWNFGWAASCNAYFNNNFNVFGNPGSTQVDVWIRHDCPISGYYFSQTYTFTFLPNGYTKYVGTLRLRKPSGGCYTLPEP